MQKFDENKILALLSELSAQTQGISGYLKQMNIQNSFDIETIKTLYGKREKYIIKLNNFCKSKYWNDFYFNNNSRWNEIYQPLMQEDKTNLEILKSNVKIIGEKLRSVLKKKSLLIYLQ
jgi:hypothetical protein